MRIVCWRLVEAKRLATAFDGEGARRYPGRWNPRGIPMVYAAGSLSLAALELLANTDGVALSGTFISIPLAFDEGVCKRLPPNALPPDWASYPAPESTRELGAAWAFSEESVALAVPSAIVPLESNYLLNPLHPDFTKVEIGMAQVFQYDPRLVKN